MKPAEILEWTMGWAWPVLILLVALTAWGIERVLTWDREYDADKDQSSCRIVGNECVCH